jgi:hypothetical protein
MLTNIPETQNTHIIMLDQILSKMVKNITFKESISLVFHTIYNISTGNYEESDKWSFLYKEFQIEMSNQIKSKWPQMIIINNHAHLCAHVIINGKPFIESDNLLILLFRLLFIENHKIGNVPSYYNFHDVLNYKIGGNDNNVIRNLSLFKIFDLLKQQLTYYLRVYKNKSYIEHQLALAIIKQID